MLFDEVTSKGRGRSIVRMRSRDQAALVASDFKQLLIIIGEGPCPVEATVIKPGVSAIPLLKMDLYP